MKQYRILYTDNHTEVVNHETMEDLVYELESFERDDVNQIHELNEDGSLGETIWTEEEGLFVSYGELSDTDDEDFVEDNEDELINKLVDKFYEGIAYMYWNEWFNMDPVEKESHVVDPILKSGDFSDIDEGKISEIFWEWAEGLDDSDFWTEEDDYLDHFNSI